MKTAAISRIAIRDILKSRSFYILFILNLSLGLSGFTTLQVFKNSFSEKMGYLSKSLMGGDLEISARRYFRGDELDKISSIVGPNAPYKKYLRMLSMARSDTRSRLVQLRGIEEGYPFYGSIQINPNPKQVPEKSTQPIEQENTQNLQVQNGPPPKGSTWITPELAEQLSITVGDKLYIGQKNFTVAGLIVEDVGLSSGPAAVAPAVLLDLEELQATGLIQKGSTFRFSHVYLIDADTDKVAEEKMIALNEALEDPSITARSHHYSGQQSSRLFLYLSDFLGLVAVSSIALSLIGVIFLFRSYLRSRLQMVAVLNALGLSPSYSRFIFILQLFISGTVAAGLSLAFAFVLLPFFLPLMQSLLPFQMENIQYSAIGQTALTTLCVGSLAGILSALPFFSGLNSLSGQDLFQESSKLQIRLSASHLFWWLPLVTAFCTLSIWVANSYQIGGLFILFFLASLLLFLFTFWIFSLACRALGQRSTLKIRLAMRAISRAPFENATLFSSLGLCALLIFLVPFLEYGLVAEFDDVQSAKRPSFFLFDIQDEQIEPFRKKMSTLNVDIQRASPMIRARLTGVNEETFGRVAESLNVSREEQRRRFFINRGLNLSTQKELSSAETVIEGQWPQTPYNWDSEKPVELSIEWRYAKRLGLKMNDVLKIEIQGVEFIGQVTSLRRVRWTSFQPNFFIQVQSGAVDDAPKTWIASLGQIPGSQKSDVQTSIVEDFPNVSVVDVSRTIEKLLKLIQRLSFAMQFMALVTFIVGLVILGSLVAENMSRKKRDFDLLGMLGADSKFISSSAMIEFSILFSVSLALGTFVAVGISYLISRFAFDGIWHLATSRVALSYLTILFIAAVIGRLTIHNQLMKSNEIRK